MTRIKAFQTLLAISCSVACSSDGAYGTGDREAIARNLGVDAAALPSGPGSMTGPGGGGTGGTAGSTPCPSYDGGFVPLVFDPVCSACHGADPDLPDWGVYSVAVGSCSAIGELVAAGQMPPRSSGVSLSASQVNLVSEWVGLGCPETAVEAAALCPDTQGPAGSAVDGASPPPAGAIAVDRVEWDAEQGTLRIEGEIANETASITVRFSGREETLENDGGRFRGEFDDVTVNPESVTVESGDGASVTVMVTAE